ncbi:MAG: aminotransferase class V-fold PLP-dependent enzyme [Peptoniphilus sp.]|nr:aminotransferase class V-fold PLP-dependent enzyme [Peptoniphilus sp.]MDD7362605.1 aminotransferase class V-fold PLP-dependent enzyme [Bacillota bacterium]MDY6044996.1 aminotransferase class V-fold PLP-dependent enzyme [Peptoniphilus sp.]
MIYLDNGATTAIKPKSVVDAVCRAMTEGYGNPGRGSHPWAQNAYRALRKARKNVAKLLNVDARIALTSGVTESLNVAIRGLISEDDHVITSEAEHNSVLRPLYATGCALDFLPLDENLAPDVTKLEDLLRDETKAVVITHASNVVGSITDLERVFEFADEHDLYLIVDGAQALGQFPVDLSKMPKDKLVYCFAGHKSLYGPTGTGGFYYGKDVDMPPLKSGGSGIESFNHAMPDEQPIKWEAGTANVHGFAGLAAGVEFVLGEDYFETKDRAFEKLLKGLRELDGYEVYYPKTHGTCCVSILKEGMSSQELALILQDHDIATRPGYHCAPRLHEYLHTKETGLCRLSTSYFTTDEEIGKTLRVLASIE